MLEVTLQPVIEHVDQTTLNALQLVLQKSICSSAITSNSLQPALTLAAHLGGGLKHKICPTVSKRVSEGPVEKTYRSAGWVNHINHLSWFCFFLLLHFICFIFRCSSQMNLCRHSRRLPMAERALNSSARTYHKLHSHIRSYCREGKKERKKLALVGQKNKLSIWHGLL